MMTMPFQGAYLAAEARAEARMRTLGQNAQCARCGEDHPFALKRESDGVILCYRCSALRHPKRRRKRPLPLLQRMCVICGFQVGSGVEAAHLIELHHVLGRAHQAGYVVPLCLNCHAKVSEQQRCLEVDLAQQSAWWDTFSNGFGSAAALVIVALGVAPDGAWWQRLQSIGVPAAAGFGGLLTLFAPTPGMRSPWTY